MGKVSIDIVSSGTPTKQQAFRPADRGVVREVSIVKLSGEAAYGALFARLSVISRSGESVLYVANLAAGYISESSNIGWNGAFPLDATMELALDVWSTTPDVVVRATIVTKRRD